MAMIDSRLLSNNSKDQKTQKLDSDIFEFQTEKSLFQEIVQSTPNRLGQTTWDLKEIRVTFNCPVSKN